jgi:hypothetical protein
LWSVWYIFGQFGTFCGQFGTFCGQFGTFCGHFGTFCGHFGTFCGQFGTFCGQFGTFCGHFGNFFSFFGLLHPEKSGSPGAHAYVCIRSTSETKKQNKIFNHPIVKPTFVN